MFILIFCLQIYQVIVIGSLDYSEDDRIKSNSLTSLIKTQEFDRKFTYIRQLHLCPIDFQQSLELVAFNRTLILYELEWQSEQKLNFLFILIENENFPLINIGNLAPHFENIYSIQCLYKSKLSNCYFRHLNIHEYDRTVIIQCENDEIDQINNSQITLFFTQLLNGQILQFNINLCWFSVRRVTIGHCLKALYNNVPLHIMKQWIDYHLLIGIEQFYIYDRTLKYKEFFQSYINRGEIVYIPYPLAKQLIYRKRFHWIDQFVGKMHCLMRVRSAFDWLGTWDLDEYLDFYSNQSKIFLSNCNFNQQNCSSMLSQYLKEYFTEYDGILLKGLNFMGKKSSSSLPFVTEQFQHRLITWNDRDKYLTRPIYTNIITIHYASLISGRSYYKNNGIIPSRNPFDDSKKLIHINHYPSSIINRDEQFLYYHHGSREYVYDSILWQVIVKLHEEKEKMKQNDKNKYWF